MFKGIALLVLLGVAGAAAQGPVVSKKDLVTAITDNKQLSELLKYASQYPAIVATLTNLGSGTVLAPNNAAFAALIKAATAAGVELDKATVEKVLKYHVITEGSFLKAGLSDGQELQTAAGVPITVSYNDGKLVWKGVGNSANDLREMKVGNIAVHIIDAVLLPIELPTPAPEPAPEPTPEGNTYPDLVDFATSNNLTELIGAVQASGLLDEVVSFNGTVFAPTNEAFEAALAALGIGAAPELTKSLKTAIAVVLSYHLVPEKVTALQDGMMLTTVQGEPLEVVVKGDKVYIKDSTGAEAEVLQADLAGDAAAYIINKVLLPEALASLLGGGAPAPAPTPASSASTLASAAAVAGSLLAAAMLL
ncbi:hypothetical protein ABPG75_012279 [Micractinium tetrahymenae]